MLNSFPVAALVGVILGFLAGLGTGGGSLLILWLTLVIDLPATDAKIINLLFFLPSALISCMFRWKQKRLDIKKVLPAIITGSTVSAIFTLLSRAWDLAILEKLFGVLLLVTGIRELFYKPKT